MPLLASEVLVEARTLLNDPTGAIYVDSPMYSLMNKAYKELQTKLNAIGISTAKEFSVVITVPAGILRLTEGDLLPIDIIYPVALQERSVGASDDQWIDMEEEEWESPPRKRTNLAFWTWREEDIKFPGATTDREVKIKYIKSLGSIIGPNSTILVLNSQTWMAQRVASIAALVLGSNPSRAAAMDSDLNRPGGIWDDLKATLIKRKQNIPVRRKRTRYRVL